MAVKPKQFEPAGRQQVSADAQELSLLKAVVVKDRAAFEQLYYLYRPRLYRFLLKHLHRSELIEEALNDVMFAVWKNAAGFKAASKVSTWIFGIAYLKGLKLLERERKAPDLNLYLTSLEPPDTPEFVQNQSMLRRYLLKLVAALPAEQRVIVELTYYNGFSYQEIAEIMQIPVNTVKTRMFHARQKLKKLIDKWEVDMWFDMR